jgi:hypothetical protein
MHSTNTTKSRQEERRKYLKTREKKEWLLFTAEQTVGLRRD